MFVVVRLVVLYWGTNAVYFDEELATGLIAAHLIEGLRLPLLDYQIAGHLGGTLFVGVLAAPFFLALGPQLFALKLVPLLLQSVSFVLWYLVGERVGGRFVAVAVACLLIAPPQLLTRFSLVAVGFHPETLLFSAAAALCLFRVTDGTEARGGRELMFGLACGLGVWVGYIFVPTLVTSLIYRTAVDRAWLQRRTSLIFALGLVLGLAPWLAFNLTHGFVGLDWFAPPGGREPVAVSARILAALRFVTVDLFFSFAGGLENLEGLVVASVFTIAAAGSVVVAALALLRRRSQAQPMLWFLIFPVVLAGAYGLNLGMGSALGRVEYSSYDGFRYLLPLYPIVLILMAYSAQTLAQQAPRFRPIGVLAVGVVVLAGMVSTWRLLSPQDAGRLMDYAAVSYKEFAFQRDDAVPLDVHRLGATDRRRHELGRGWSAAVRHLEGRALPGDEQLPLTTEVMVMPPVPGSDPSGYALTCAYLGEAALARFDLDQACEWSAMTGLGASIRLWAIDARQFTHQVPRLLGDLATLADRVPPRSRSAVLEGFGQGLGAGLELTVLERLGVVLAAIDHVIADADRADVYRGLGRGLAWRFGQDPRRLGDIVERVRVDQRARCAEGIQEFENRLALY